jgi:AcrR family transcriptional regulator
MRADAIRSRRLLMNAGIAAFAEDGLDVQVSEITRRAGLAKGTFFRHFPTKHALLVAILMDSVRRQLVTAEALLADGGAELVERYMSAIAEEIVPLRGIMETVILRGGLGPDEPSMAQLFGELMGTVGLLLTKAQELGEVRDDITALDIYTLVLAATNSSAHFFFRDHPEFWRRQLAITLDGLRPAAARRLPVEAPLLGPPLPHSPAAAVRSESPARARTRE